jgi:hypothetical protein
MMCLVLRSWFLVSSCVRWLCLLVRLSFTASAANEEPSQPRTKNKEPSLPPRSGKVSPVGKAHSYRGELVFVDHANRRGSIRVQGSGMFFRNDPHPFALLPYAIVRYHGAPADLRDIPLGTVMHVRAFLPPDPKTSAVPVLPVDSKKKDANHNRGAGIFPPRTTSCCSKTNPATASAKDWSGSSRKWTSRTTKA